MSGPLPSTIDTDLACVKCGYNLRGLSQLAKCPECTCPVSKSMYTSEPLDAWQIRQLRNALVLVVAGSIPSGLSFATYVYSSIHSGWGVVTNVANILALPLCTGFLIIRCVGIWRFTDPSAMPRPLARIADPRRPLRVLAIVLVVAALAASLCELALARVLPGSRMFGSSISTLRSGAIVVLFLGGLLSGVSLLAAAESIAGRVGDQKLVAQLNNSAAWMPSVFFYGLIVYLAGPFIVWIMYIRLLGLLLLSLQRRCITS